MTNTLGQRIFLSHLELSYRLGRKVTLAEFGEMVAERLGRASPFSGAAVSRWESGAQVPTPQIIEAIGMLTHTDPGWISHGDRSAAPRPPRLDVDSSPELPTRAPTPISVPARKKPPTRRHT